MKTPISLRTLKQALLEHTAHTTNTSVDILRENGFTITLNEQENGRGDLAMNAALVLARHLKKPGQVIAQELISALKKAVTTNEALAYILRTEVAGPGFINITLHPSFWGHISTALAADAHTFFAKEHTTQPTSYLIEFVSANPTGPLHLGHGRNAIIGDILRRVLSFAGHRVSTEFYVNDTGAQMQKLGQSLYLRCKEALGQAITFPADGYHGTYLQELATRCIAEYTDAILTKDKSFFIGYAHDALLTQQKKDLEAYGVSFDRWFSEKHLHENGAIPTILKRLQTSGMLYEQNGALWFAATKFGDDKDRVVRKQDGTLTYIAADIAYHANKFERGAHILIDILGQDHHGYVQRLKGTMKALGYPEDQLHIILYQLVSIKKGSIPVKMSKRAGVFTSMRKIVDTIGSDAARFFFLHKKAEAHLELDIEMALKKNQENPVYYLQYAYVRTVSILAKAREKKITLPPLETYKHFVFTSSEKGLLKKALGFSTVVQVIESHYATHLLAQYALDLAQTFHAFYTNNKVLNADDMNTTQRRLGLVTVTHHVLGLTHDLLGLTKRESM